MNTVSVVLPDGTVHEQRTPLDPGFAVAILAGGRWVIRCYTLTRRHAVWVAQVELGRKGGWVVDSAVVPTTVTRPPRCGTARRGPAA